MGRYDRILDGNRMDASNHHLEIFDAGVLHPEPIERQFYDDDTRLAMRFHMRHNP